MLTAVKNYSGELISGIHIKSEVALFIVLGKENFQINLGTEELEYFLINHNDYEYELSLKENIPESDLVLLYTVKDENQNDLKGSIRLDSKPIEEEPQTEIEEKITNLKIIDNKLIFEFKSENENFLENIKKYECIIEEFNINHFEDFYESYKILNDFIYIPKTKKFYLEFQFNKNKVYKIVILNKETLEEIKMYYIHKKPDVYFSSIYHLNRSFEQVDIDLKLKENFDTKLLIWNESLKLLALCEISIESLPKLTEDIIALFSEYISNKLILNKMIYMFSSQFLPDTEQYENNAVKGKRIGDYQITQGGESGDSSKIKMISDKILKIESQILNSIKFLSYGKFSNTSNVVLNRNKVLKRPSYFKVR